MYKTVLFQYQKIVIETNLKTYMFHNVILMYSVNDNHELSWTDHVFRIFTLVRVMSVQGRKETERICLIGRGRARTVEGLQTSVVTALSFNDVNNYS